MRHVDAFRAIYDRGVTYYPPLCPLVGGVKACILLAYLIRWIPDDGSAVFRTQAQIETDLGMTREEQEGARLKLRRLGFLHEERRGVPARLYFTVDLDLFDKAIDAAARPVPQTSMGKTPILDRGKPPDLTEGNTQTGSGETPNLSITDQDTDRERDQSTNQLSAATPRRRRMEIQATWTAAIGGRSTLRAAQLDELESLDLLALETGNSAVYGAVDYGIKQAALKAERAPYPYAIKTIKNVIADAGKPKPSIQQSAEEEYPPTQAELESFDHVMWGKMRRQEYEKRVWRAQHAAQTGGWLSDEDKAAMETARRERERQPG